MPSGVYKRTEYHMQRLLERSKSPIYGMKGKKHSLESREKMSKSRKGQNAGSKNYFWNGGKYIAHGYVKIWKPTHPNADSKGYVPEHRLKMEKKIGRYLISSEIVHHINHIRNDNRMSNLRLMNKIDHDRMHTIERHKTIKKF